MPANPMTFPGCCKDAWTAGLMILDPESPFSGVRPIRASDINLCPYCGTPTRKDPGEERG